MTTAPFVQQNLANAYLQADATAREQALLPQSFIVEAPAGAGKTELLTQRFLVLLTQVDHPEEVVALTFTNKAATEMRDRILGSLELAAGGNRPADVLPHKQKTFDISQAVLRRDEALGWQLRQHPGRLKIVTIDSLCGSLVAQMPFLSRFGAQPRVSADPTAYYREAAREAIALIEGRDTNADIVAAALDYLDNDISKLESLLTDMLARRDQWLRHTYRDNRDNLRSLAEAGLWELATSALEKIAALIDPQLQSELMPSVCFAASNLPEYKHLANWQTPLIGKVEEMEHWLFLRFVLLTNTGDRRIKLNKKLGFPADRKSKPFKDAMAQAAAKVTDEALAALHRLHALPAVGYAEEDWDVIDVFYRLLQVANAKLWLGLQRGGEVDFTAISQRAVAALGTEDEPTNLALALDYRIRHLLIDEFQDTSPSQVELIEGLTRGWQHGDGRTLFLVGDPLQSIYRFRKADVGLFLRVQERGIGSVQLQPLRLYRNNRSAPAIVHWINQAFPEIFPEQSDPATGAVRYSEAATDRREDPDAGVSTHVIIHDADTDVEQNQAEHVLKIIDSARMEDHQAEIAVLVRSRSHLTALVKEIRRSRPALPFQAVEIEGLAGRQPIQDLLSLTRALLQRADRVHWLALLRAPWCGLTLADLHHLCGKDHGSTVWQLMQDDALVDSLSSDGRKRLLRVRRILRDAFRYQGRWQPRRWIQNIWRRLGGPQCMGKPTDWQDVDAFWGLLDQLTVQGDVRLESLEDSVAALYAATDPNPEALRLQMMTIHKSKGLEFDCVIVPGLHSTPPNADPLLLRWESVTADGRECLVPAAVKQKGEINSNSVLYDYLARLDAQRDAHETARVLYVAATRAKRRLHLVGALRPDAEGFKMPARRSLLELLWKSGPVSQAFLQGAEDAASKVSRDDVQLAGQSRPATSLLVRMRSDFLGRIDLPSAPKDAEVSPALSGRHGRSDVGGGPALSASVGTLVHRCLEIIANATPETWNAGRVVSMQPAYDAWLRSRGHSSKDAASGAQLAVTALTATLESEMGRWILREREESHAELALTNVSRRNDDPIIAHHVIDRTFVEDGIRWIIDFKTVDNHGRQGQDWLINRAEEYRPQLDRYADLFAGQGLPIRKAVFFVVQAVFVELKDAGMAPGQLFQA